LYTAYRFTGQRSEEANLGSLYDYGGRFYSPVFGRFLSADSIVPRPGDPQSLNRYSYVRNNPLILVDPSGMAECAAGDMACWQSEWEWKNRWYEAHGYGWGGDHWGNRIDARFKDAAILNDVMMEAGISIVWSWQTPDVVTHIAQGIVRFGQALEGGLARLKELLGGGATIKRGALFGHPYAPPWFDNTIFIPECADAAWLRQTVVHELAHVIDWHGNFSQAWAKENRSLTSYAAGFHPYPAKWEVWADAVKVFVFGQAEAEKVSGVLRVTGNELTVQMSRMHNLLGGKR
jgi:RHS repeat-associated protein